MLFRFMSSHTNTSWLLCFNMALSPRGTAKHFTKASEEENFATSQAPRGAVHVTRADAPAPSAIALRAQSKAREGRAPQRRSGGWKLGSSIPAIPGLQERWGAECFCFARLRASERRSGVFGSH